MNSFAKNCSITPASIRTTMTKIESKKTMPVEHSGLSADETDCAFPALLRPQFQCLTETHLQNIEERMRLENKLQQRNAKISQRLAKVKETLDTSNGAKLQRLDKQTAHKVYAARRQHLIKFDKELKSYNTLM